MGETKNKKHVTTLGSPAWWKSLSESVCSAILFQPVGATYRANPETAGWFQRYFISARMMVELCSSENHHAQEVLALQRKGVVH